MNDTNDAYEQTSVRDYGSRNNDSLPNYEQSEANTFTVSANEDTEVTENTDLLHNQEAAVEADISTEMTDTFPPELEAEEEHSYIFPCISTLKNMKASCNNHPIRSFIYFLNSGFIVLTEIGVLSHAIGADGS